MQAAGYGAYQRTQAETSSPGQLIALLYDALMKNLGRAETSLRAVEYEAAHEPLIRAQDIVLELVASLDIEASDDAGRLARQLAPLYEYMYRRLLDASLQKDADAVAEVYRLITPMRDAWRNAIAQVSYETSFARVPSTASYTASGAEDGRGTRRG